MDVGLILEEYGIQYSEMALRFLVNCPFHPDVNPSCGIWKDTGYFKCFGCGVSGDLAEFIGERSNISPIILRRKFREPALPGALEHTIRTFLLNTESSFRYLSLRSFHKVYPRLKKGSPGWQYLVGPRKLSPETIRRFDAREGVGCYLGRIVFPIYTMDGRLLSYVGRTYRTGVYIKTKKARSPHRTFFGLFELFRDMDLPDMLSVLVVVEGEFDAMYLQQYGIPAVSNMGTQKMNSHKIALLRRYASKVVLSYDSDEAGEGCMYGHKSKHGWIKGQLEVLNPYIPTVALPLPIGKDPNNLTEKEITDLYGDLNE